MIRCVVTLARDPYHVSAFAETPPARAGSFAKSRLLRVAFRYPFEHRAAWPGDAGPSLLAFVARRRSWGSTRPFAGLIPLIGWTIPPDQSGGLASDQLAPIHCRLGISAGPGPRVVRASASAPIDFRRGDRSPVGGNEICKSDRPGMLMASTSGLRLPSAVHVAGTRSSVDLILPWALPLAGLSDTLPCIAPGPTPRAITGPRYVRRATHSPPTRPIRSWAFATLLPITHKVPDGLPARAEVRDWRKTEPSPRFVAALQRVDGADALSVLTIGHTAASGRNPV